MSQIYSIRLSHKDRALFTQAADAKKQTLADWLRDAGRQHANLVKKRAACLDYPDWPLSAEAEQDKHYVRRQFLSRNACH